MDKFPATPVSFPSLTHTHRERERFEDGQLDTMKGVMLLPSAVITEPDTKPFLELYSDEVPSKHTLDAELVLWTQRWTEEWSEQWKKLKEQHVQATGSELKLTTIELNRLNKGHFHAPLRLPCWQQKLIFSQTSIAFLMCWQFFQLLYVRLNVAFFH